MKYRIDESVFDKIGELSSTRGGADAKKWEETGLPLSAEELKFPDYIVKMAIHRVTEKKHTPSDNLPELSWLDLPPLDDGVPAKA